MHGSCTFLPTCMYQYPCASCWLDLYPQHTAGDVHGCRRHHMCVCVCVCPSYSSDEAIWSPVPTMPSYTTCYFCVHTGYLLVLASSSKCLCLCVCTCVHCSVCAIWARLASAMAPGCAVAHLMRMKSKILFVSTEALYGYVSHV